MPPSRCAQELSDTHDDKIVRHCLRCLSTLRAASWDDWLSAADAPTLALDPHAVCRFKAERLFRKCQRWPEDAFLAMWADSLFSGLEPKPALFSGLEPKPDLDGLAVSFEENKSRYLEWFDARSLPMALGARFAALWAVKPVWTARELEPYLVEVLEPGVALAELLQKHTRAVSDVEGNVTYVRR